MTWIPATQLVARAITHQMDEIPVSIVGIDDLIELKRSTGRTQDIADIALLERLREQHR
jgi:predicted nucleotidyltransferase